jgi:hypothetical protein
MKMQGKWEGGIGHFQLQVDHFFQGRGRMQVQVVLAAQQAHTGDETDKTKVMIAMQVRDKNMVDAAAADAVFGHLHLGAFPAIH